LALVCRHDLLHVIYISIPHFFEILIVKNTKDYAKNQLNNSI
jgi:hypothetical protein